MENALMNEIRNLRKERNELVKELHDSMVAKTEEKTKELLEKIADIDDKIVRMGGQV